MQMLREFFPKLLLSKLSNGTNLKHPHWILFWWLTVAYPLTAWILGQRFVCVHPLLLQCIDSVSDSFEFEDAWSVSLFNFCAQVTCMLDQGKSRESKWEYETNLGLIILTFVGNSWCWNLGKVSHVNMVILTFILRAWEGRIGNYNVQLVLDALIRAASHSVSSEQVVVNFVKGWDAVFISPPTGSGKLVIWCFCGPLLVWDAKFDHHSNGASSLVNSTGSNCLVGVTYE